VRADKDQTKADENKTTKKSMPCSKPPLDKTRKMTKKKKQKAETVLLCPPCAPIDDEIDQKSKDAPRIELMDLEQRCPRCLCAVELDQRRITNKGSGHWICKACSNRSGSLYKLYGKWPPPTFKALGAKEQQAFDHEIRDMNDAKVLKMKTDEFLDIADVKHNSVAHKGDYLPLGVYATMGYDVAAIAAKCDDFQEDPILGRVYRVQVTEKKQIHLEERRRFQRCKVGEPDKCAIVSQGKPGAKKGKDEIIQQREEDKAAREQVRQEHAVAMQAARDKMKAKQVATKWLPKVVQLCVQIKSALGSKFVKLLPKSHTDHASKTLASLTEWKKTLNAVAAGNSKEPVPITEQECARKCKDGADIHNKLLFLVSSSTKHV